MTLLEKVEPLIARMRSIDMSAKLVMIGTPTDIRAIARESLRVYGEPRPRGIHSVRVEQPGMVYVMDERDAPTV